MRFVKPVISGKHCLFLIILIIPVFPGMVSYSQPDSTLIAMEEGFSPDLVIQVGAFRFGQNALALKERLSDNLEKDVVIVSEDDYFKVRITGFKSLEEMEKILPSLGLLGMKNLWIFNVKKHEEIEAQAMVKPDTTVRVVEQIPEPDLKEAEAPLITEPKIALQAGVFHRRSKAFRAQRRITAKLRLPVEIVQEWEYYKVIITGFHSTEETHEYYPRLAKIGYPDILPVENYR